MKKLTQLKEKYTKLFFYKKYMLYNWFCFKAVNYKVMTILEEEYNLNTCVDLNYKMYFENIK